MALTLLTYPLVTKTTTYTVTLNDCIVLCNGTFTVNLYAVAGNIGRQITIRNIGTGTITIDGNASENIDGATTYSLAAGASVTLCCDGAAWYSLTPKVTTLGTVGVNGVMTINGGSGGRLVLPVGTNLYA